MLISFFRKCGNKWALGWSDFKRCRGKEAWGKWQKKAKPNWYCMQIFLLLQYISTRPGDKGNKPQQPIPSMGIKNNQGRIYKSSVGRGDFFYRIIFLRTFFYSCQPQKVLMILGENFLLLIFLTWNYFTSNDFYLHVEFCAAELCAIFKKCLLFGGF